MNDLARGTARDRDILAAAFDDVLRSGYLIMGRNHDTFQPGIMWPCFGSALADARVVEG